MFDSKNKAERKKLVTKTYIIMQYLLGTELDESAYNSVLKALEEDLIDKNLSYYEYCTLCGMVDSVFRR